MKTFKEQLETLELAATQRIVHALNLNSGVINIEDADIHVVADFGDGDDYQNSRIITITLMYGFTTNVTVESPISGRIGVSLDSLPIEELCQIADYLIK